MRQMSIFGKCQFDFVEGDDVKYFARAAPNEWKGRGPCIWDPGPPRLPAF